MSKPLVARRGGARVILWGRVCSRALDAVIAFLVLFFIVTCVVGASNEGHFFDTWWGGHLFLLLSAFVLLPALAAAGVPLLCWLQVPFDRLSDPDADSADAKARDQADRRLTRLGLAGLMAVVIVALLVGFFYLEENERGERAWQRYKREQEARGERLDPSALVPPPVPDDQNFASTPYLAPLFDFVPGTQQPLDPKGVERTSHLAPSYDAASSRLKLREVPRSNSWTAAGIDLPAWHAAFLKGTNSDPSEDDAARAFRLRYGLPSAQAVPAPPAQPETGNAPPSTNRTQAAAAVLAALAEAEPVLEELRAASRRPYSRFNLRYDLDNPAMIHLPHYSILKRTFQVLQLRASAELALGRVDHAAEDIQFMFRLTDAIRGEPMLIGQLVRMAELSITLQPLAEGLARHQWSEPQLRAFEERLQEFNLLADARQALQGERILFGSGVIDYVRRSSDRYNAFQGIDVGSGNNQSPQVNWQSMLLATVPSGWFSFEKLNYSRAFQNYFLPIIDIPARRISLDACRRADAYLESLSATSRPALVLRHQVFAALMLPALSRAVQKTALCQTGADCAAVACALERYRLAHGQFPDSLEVLVPAFISQLPRDLISGQPLKYRRTPDGQYVLYSVGWNETDDGGILGLKQDGQHLDNTTGDWVWRLPRGA